MNPTSGLKPLALWQSLLLTLTPAIAAYVALHYAVPAWLADTGRPFLAGYLVWWMTWMGLVFLVSVLAYRWEGNPLTWQAFASRYRLRALNSTDGLWIAGLLAAHALTVLALGAAGNWLASFPSLAMPASFPPELQPGGMSELVPGEFMGMALKGQWWLLGLYFLGWVLNIFGEEFWWRGYLLPRQELAHGRWTWVIHGLLWGANHLFQKWTLPLLIPTALLYAYGAQKARNTWVPIVVHGLLNLVPLATIVIGVLG